MSGRAGISRTHEAVERQIAAMGCERFDIGVLRSDGKMLLREGWLSGDIVNATGWLRHENAEGAQIYIRPAGPHALTLIDDLTRETIERMSAEGCEPALVVEMSPGNFQAWLKHAEILDARVGTANSPPAVRPRSIRSSARSLGRNLCIVGRD
jgi:hypothetical protein